MRPGILRARAGGWTTPANCTGFEWSVCPSDRARDAASLELRPDDPNILYNAACVYGILNQNVEALALLRRLKQAGILNVDRARRAGPACYQSPYPSEKKARLWPPSDRP